MEKAKVGMMALSLARERKDLAANSYRVVLEKLRTFDEIEVVEVERLCLNTPEATSTARGLENRNVDCILMVVGAWIKASMVVTAAQHVTRPLILCHKIPLKKDKREGKIFLEDRNFAPQVGKSG